MHRAIPGQVHFIGICGRAQGAVALELARRGLRVTGSDQGTFGEMPERLRAGGLAFFEKYEAGNIPVGVEHVVIGAYCKRGNPEVEQVLDERISYSSFPRFLGDFVLGRGRNLVIAGTNGKTTTTAMLTWMLETAGLAPDYLIGGEARNLPGMARFAEAALCVLEGDEYPSGLGDPAPKFLHYAPDLLGITNIAHDHVDIFATDAQYRQLFYEAVKILPGRGQLFLNADDAACRELAGKREGAVWVGFGKHATRRITGWQQRAGEMRFRFMEHELRLPGLGRMNAFNASLAAAMAVEAGAPWDAIEHALATFQGVKGRLEPFYASPELLVIEDEGYHPNAIAEVVGGLKRRYPGRRLVVVLQPRYTGGAEGPFQRDLSAALEGAGLVLIGYPADFAMSGPAFSRPRLCADLEKRGIEAVEVPFMRDMDAALLERLRPRDVVLLTVAYKNEPFLNRLRESLPAWSPCAS